ncbi:MAG: glycosyltransferase family 4 protein [Candidatus Thermoplasmatota archaeon]|jgi:glycosyltransferase involved in cell wall biosynthesis
MRILAITPYYAPEGGGLERYARAILSALALRGHEVEALSFTRTGLGDAKDGGVHVRRTRASLCLGNTPIHAGFPVLVARRIRESRPDLVVAHTPVPFPAEMAYLAARRAGVPFVATYHAGKLRGSSPGLDALAALDRATLERGMIAGATGLIAVGPYVRDHALARERQRVELVPPGVDTDWFNSPNPAHGRGILFAAPLSRSYRWKGADVLLRAFRRVRKRLPDATLTLVGGGDRLDEFRRLATPSSGLRVLGRVDEPTLRDEYRRAAVVALPSTTDAESFGMALAEANACGRPVVASDVGGMPDFVRPGDNGLLARPGDEHDLAAKLVEVLADPEAAAGMGERGRLRVTRDHAWDALAIRTERIFERAVA